MNRVAADVRRLILFPAKEVRASYSENEIKGNARPHPGPLPQEREKLPQCSGIFMLSGAALPHGDLRRLLRFKGSRPEQFRGILSSMRGKEHHSLSRCFEIRWIGRSLNQ